MALNRIAVLVGGVGGAKLAHGLAQHLAPGQLTVIVNTGDDFWHYGLKICPDLDTVMYTLAGWVDKANGWGVAGDTTAMLDSLRRYGEMPWFRLGDQDVATHLLRTQAIRSGETLTQITQQLTKRAGILHAILPMTDAEMPTMIDTVEYGEIEFQEYFVRYRWQPTVKAIRSAGEAAARPSQAVERAICEADAILFAPSNPWLSIAPILRVPGMADLLRSRPVPRVAISPIVEGKALKGPAAKIMAELGYAEVSAREVAAYYQGMATGFVYDQRDAGQPVHIESIRAVQMDTVMKNESDRAAFAGRILEWIETG
ncbi:MAG: 2-phospho-L-lactate transferase [bacterium]|nr:2-phospho-L-lactate transferase [bacterium]